MTPVVNRYFSGGGLLDIGLFEAGIESGQSFEIDSACCATARANFSHPVVQCDLQEKLVFNEQDCDAMVFTYPCNRYAEASAIHGKCIGDVLYLHAFRHVALKRPEVFSLENVPGMKKFPVVMEAMSRLPDYYIQVFCPVSSQMWLPQRRDRLILIGSRRSFQWNKPSSRRRVSLKEILEKNPQMDIPRYVKKRLRGGYRDLPIISDPAKGDIAPTCVAHYSKDLSTRLVVDRRSKLGVRPYTVREYARLQGVPDWFNFIGSDAQAYRMIGNGVSVPVGRWIGREIRRYFKMN
jgi:DNA (cytosine-5)-methyltransferase 1